MQKTNTQGYIYPPKGYTLICILEGRKEGSIWKDSCQIIYSHPQENKG